MKIIDNAKNISVMLLYFAISLIALSFAYFLISQINLVYPSFENFGQYFDNYLTPTVTGITAVYLALTLKATNQQFNINLTIETVNNLENNLMKIIDNYKNIKLEIIGSFNVENKTFIGSKAIVIYYKEIEKDGSFFSSYDIMRFELENCVEEYNLITQHLIELYENNIKSRRHIIHHIKRFLHFGNYYFNFPLDKLFKACDIQGINETNTEFKSLKKDYDELLLKINKLNEFNTTLTSQTQPNDLED